MKKLVMLLVLVYVPPVYADGPYVSGGAGAILSGNMVGHALGARIGKTVNGLDWSFGFERADGDLDAERIVSNGFTLHTVTAEVYKVFTLGGRWDAKLGGGLGYYFPELSGPEKADTGVGFVVGGGADYWLSNNLSLGATVRGSFFRTDTRRPVNDSHVETLSNGQAVEVLDFHYIGRDLNLDSVVVGVALKYYFD